MKGAAAVTPFTGFVRSDEDLSAGSVPIATAPARAAGSYTLKPNHVRSLALAGAVVGVALLPVAAAQATPPQSAQSQTGGANQAAVQASGAPSASPAAKALAGEYCGPDSTGSAAGGSVQLQVCVEEQHGTVFAQAYVVAGGTAPQLVAVDLNSTDGTLGQAQCVIAAGDASGVCATSPVPVVAGAGVVDAVAEAVGQGRPVSDGVLHVESGPVTPGR